LKSIVLKRSIVVHGHKTSVSLEEPFWLALKEIAKSRDMTLSGVVAFIDGHRDEGNLSSTIRLFVLDHVRAQLAARASQLSPAAPAHPQRVSNFR
jgi:predicted DNA-binding ribbon-helix-helix protein